MLNPNGEAIYSAGLTEFADLVYDIVVTKAPKGKNVSKLWDEVYKILPILDSLEDVDYLEEENANALYSCLVELLNIFDTSEYPTPTVLPAVIIGTGPAGATGATGPKGDTGGGKTFNAGLISTTTTVDSFIVSQAYGARWDYLVNGTAQRVGTIRATWTEDGSGIEIDDTSTADLNGSTAGIEFSVIYTGGLINLVANITSGTWYISGTRYLIPESGTYVPVGTSLTDGYMFVGNSANMAQERQISGAIAVANDGTVSINKGVVSNIHIATNTIAPDKLEILTPERLVVTDINGQLTTGIPSSNLTYLDATSSIQAQLDGKLNLSGGTMTGNLFAQSIQLDTDENLILQGNGTISMGNGGISTNGGGQFLGGIATVSAEFIFTHVVNIGAWNMDTTGSVLINHGIADITKIISITGVIRNDAGTQIYPILVGYNNATTGADLSCSTATTTQLLIVRNGGSIFDNAAFSSVLISRGYITITYTV